MNACDPASASRMHRSRSNPRQRSRYNGRVASVSHGLFKSDWVSLRPAEADPGDCMLSCLACNLRSVLPLKILPWL